MGLNGLDSNRAFLALEFSQHSGWIATNFGNKCIFPPGFQLEFNDMSRDFKVNLDDLDGAFVQHNGP